MWQLNYQLLVFENIGGGGRSAVQISKGTDIVVAGGGGGGGNCIPEDTCGGGG